MDKPGSDRLGRVDARKLSRTELREKREQAVALYRDGVSPAQIANRIGISQTAVRSAIKSFFSGDESALMPAARGKRLGSGRSLTAAQEAEVRRMIRVRRPWYYRLKDALWSHETVQRLIVNQCGVDLSERAVRQYLARWGLTLGDKRNRPRERCSTDVQKWLALYYVEIQQNTQRIGAEIYWLNRPIALDPASFSDTCTSPGPASAVEEAGTIKAKLALISATTNQGKLLWAISDSPIGASDQIKFMEALRNDTRKQALFLIRYDLKAYSSQDVRIWLRETDLGVRMFPE